MKQIRPPATIERFRSSVQRLDLLVCEVHGCAATTLGRKPFCKRHADRMPQVQRILAALGAS